VRGARPGRSSTSTVRTPVSGSSAAPRERTELRGRLPTGAVLTQTRFTPTAQDGDSADGSEETATPNALVNVVIPAEVPDAVRLEIRSVDGTVVAGSDISASAPTASIEVPAVGTADTVHVTWQTGDPDGDALSNTLLYSADGGSTWQMVAADITGSSVDLERWSLPASQQALLRVVTSDGLRSTEATSPVFALPNLAPQVTIASPTDGTVLTGAQAFALTAQAYDAEDGALDGTSVRWVSDLDGQLGTGATVLKRADELSEGTHTITVTVTDSAGARAAATTQVVVRRLADTTPEEPQAACEVRYVIHGTWDVGSTVQVVVKNTGTAAWNGWSIEWSLPAMETVSNSWSTDLSISGSTVTARSLSWNAVVQPGAEVTFGLNGAFPSGTVASVPTTFRTAEGLCS
jgi:cellulase/cellobiase CelA1